MKKDLMKMLEALINDNNELAQVAFHEHIISKSRKQVVREDDEMGDEVGDEDHDLGDVDAADEDNHEEPDMDDMGGEEDHDEDDLGGEEGIPEITVRFDPSKEVYVVKCGDEEVELGAKTKEEAQMEAQKVVENMLAERWGTKYKTPESKKGMWDGWTKAELEAELAKLKKSGPHKRGSAADTKMKQINFALRAKAGWPKGKKNESHEVEGEMIGEAKKAKKSKVTKVNYGKTNKDGKFTKLKSK